MFSCVATTFPNSPRFQRTGHTHPKASATANRIPYTCVTLDRAARVRAELLTSCMAESGRYQLEPSPGGGEGTRTHDPLLAKQVLYQLSYAPLGSPARLRVSSSSAGVVGLTGFEPVTSRLSGGCSNQLSYRPGISGSKDTFYRCRDCTRQQRRRARGAEAALCAATTPLRSSRCAPRPAFRRAGVRWVTFVSVCASLCSLWFRFSPVPGLADPLERR